MCRPNLLNKLVAIWLTCYATLSWASTSLSQDIRSYDYESFLWAGAAGLLGGVGRFILTMASTQRVVLRVPKESWQDAVTSIIAGWAGYVVVQGASSLIVAYWSAAGVPRDARTLILVGAGWLGLRFFGKLDDLGTAAVQGLQKKVNDGALPTLPAATPKEGE